MKDRHVVITGGAGALGEAVTGLLTERGALCHVPRREDGVDLTDERKVNEYYAALPSLWASIHLAGGFAMGKLADTDLAAFRAMHDQNGVTCFLSCRAAARAMARTGGGRIVNVAARPAVVPSSGMVAYATSKAVVAALTQHLAEELKGEGILVNAVLPSVMDTPANRRAMPRADHASWPKTADVAQAIVFLASPENVLTSGALVPVYGRA
jgi:NAD(P)-dependent dehydrogenase (short-subunit alcohol dehydrogenase family)